MLNKNKGIVFRADITLGYGHIKRSISLGEVFMKNEIEVEFFIEKHLYNLTFSNLKIEYLENEEEFFHYLSSQKKSIIVILDGYFVNASYIEKVKSIYNVEKVVILDVNKEGILDADLLINPAPYALEYYKDVANNKYLLGPKYAWIGDEFYLSNNFIQYDNYTVLVSLGGSKHNFTLLIIELAKKFADIDFVIIDCNFSDEDSLELKNVSFLKSVPSLAPYIGNADLLIIGGGTTVYEAVILNKKCIVVPLNLSQRAFSYWWNKEGYINLYNGDLDFLEFSTFFKQVIEKKDVRYLLKDVWIGSLGKSEIFEIIMKGSLDV